LDAVCEVLPELGVCNVAFQIRRDGGLRPRTHGGHASRD